MWWTIWLYLTTEPLCESAKMISCIDILQQLSFITDNYSFKKISFFTTISVLEWQLDVALTSFKKNCGKLDIHQTLIQTRLNPLFVKFTLGKFLLLVMLLAVVLLLISPKLNLAEVGDISGNSADYIDPLDYDILLMDLPVSKLKSKAPVVFGFEYNSEVCWIG